MMLTEFGKIFVFFILGIVFVAMGLLVAKIIRPHNPTPEKKMSYECGEDPIGAPWVTFNIRFYVVALIFILFDVELVVLFPWAVVFKSMGFGAYFAGAIFIVVLFLADFYLWSKGDLEWVRPNPIIPKLENIVDRLPLRQIVEKPAVEAVVPEAGTENQES
jgi:NADH-quinone oxidoreductase subunit A